VKYIRNTLKISTVNRRCKMHKGFVLLNCDLGAEEYVVEELNNIPEVTNAYVTFGAYDVVAIVYTDTQKIKI